jgi:hypothetical protein
MDQSLRRAVEAAGVLEVTVERNARRPLPGGVEARRRQRAQVLALVLQALGDDVAAGRMAVRQRNPVAPVDVDLIELGQRR